MTRHRQIGEKATLDEALLPSVQCGSSRPSFDAYRWPMYKPFKKRKQVAKYFCSTGEVNDGDLGT